MASISFEKTCRELGIPDEIRRGYEKKGVKKLYEWQVECLNRTGALRGSNVVYCAPTGGGKTLVAELVLLKTACALRKKCLFVLPYVSLVVEKHYELQRLLLIYNKSKPKEERIRVKAFHSESKCGRRINDDILICTIEKANSILNQFISSRKINTLGCCIIDEMHTIGDETRGYCLEILVSKLKFLQQKVKEQQKNFTIQTVALSATISNLAGIASWFDATLYQTSYRPVCLKEFIVSGENVIDSKSGTYVRLLTCFSNFQAMIEDVAVKNRLKSLTEETRQILCLCIEGVHHNHQVLIFCSSRNQCQNLAKLLSDIFPILNKVSASPCQVDESLRAKRFSTRKKLKEMDGTNGLSEDMMDNSPQLVLQHTIMEGVAFHHAGLSSSERAVIEKAYKNGAISILTATSTLAAGVNLPAGRVIIKSAYFGGNLITPAQYHQMCGRAGRAGFSKVGESYVLAKNTAAEREKMIGLSTASLPPICSQMNPRVDSGKALLRVLLELLVLGLCCSHRDIEEYVEQTLLYSEITQSQSEGYYSAEGLKNEVTSLINFLLAAKAVESKVDDRCSSIKVTRFGRAVMESNMNLDEAFVIYEDLLNARKTGLTLESNLNLLYLVTPLSTPLVPDFLKLSQVIDNARNNKNRSISAVFICIGIGEREEATIRRWGQCPPSYSSILNATDILRKLKLEHRQCDDQAKSAARAMLSLSEFECTLLCKCKRIWGASALNMLVECQSHSKVSHCYSTKMKQITISDIQTLASNTSLLCSQLVKFCREIGWPDFERLIDYAGTELLSDGLMNEHKAVMHINGMNPKLAKILASKGVLTPHDLVSSNPQEIAQAIQLNAKFEIEDSLLKSNSDECDSSEVIEIDKAQQDQQDNHRRNVIRLVHNLIASARDLIVSEEAKKDDEALDVLDVVESGDDLAEGSDESDHSSSSTEENSDDESEDERCGYMYQTSKWYQLSNKEIQSSSRDDGNSQTFEKDNSFYLPRSSLSPVVPSHKNKNIDDDEVLQVFSEENRNLELEEGTTPAVDKHQKDPSSRNPTKSKTPLLESTGKLVSSSTFSSPYLVPFTPSKHLARGRYLYLPQTNCSCPSSAYDAITSPPASTLGHHSSSQDFSWATLRNNDDCSIFLQELRKCRCVSFEFLYTPIPTANLGSGSDNGISPSSILDAWRPLVAFYPSAFLMPNAVKATVGLKDLSQAMVLTGICFCFGGSTGYYMPLPSTLPLLSLPNQAPSCPRYSRQVCLDMLPESSQLLICRFVGFTSFFAKCPGLSKCLRKGKGESKLFQAPQRNPLLAVSRLWVARARYALRLEWLTGKCIEWRLCNEIMTSEMITKVAVGMKSKIVGLRERDVLMKGYIEDPELAFQYLDSSSRPNAFRLELPSIIQNCKQTVNTSFGALAAKTCKVAVEVMRSMAKMESELKKRELFESFINIEMPLCVTVADSERNGFPVCSEYANQLRQDLHDRNKIIEYYCQKCTTSELSQFSLDPSSQKDVARMKSILTKLASGHVTEVLDKYKEQYLPTSNKQTQWSHGKKSMPRYDAHKSTLIEGILSANPLMRIIKEHRTHSRLIPLLQSILSNRSRVQDNAISEESNHDRVCAVFNVLGTETGRLIVTNPPLQQIPHDCEYSKAGRVSLHTELSNALRRGEHVRGELLRKLNAGQGNFRLREWVRMVSLHKNRKLWDQRNYVGVTQEVYDAQLDSFHEHSTGKLICILNRNITETIECEGSLLPINLLKVWNDAGFEYSEQEAANISIVKVDIKGKCYFYPADQVFRLAAPLLPNAEEANAMCTTSQALSQSQSQSDMWSMRREDGACAVIERLLKKLQEGATIEPSDFERYWQTTLINPRFGAAPTVKVNPRDCFVASSGYSLLTSDYCQIELRLLAHFSMDALLCEAFCDPNGHDIFRGIASRWMNVAVEDVSSDERNRVKQLCYALLYGAGPSKVAADAGCTVQQADTWIKEFLGFYPGIKLFMNDVKSSCKSLGYVQTLLGRKRYLPNINHAQSNERSRAERQAVNTVCQGSAADLIKLAMVNIHHTLCQRYSGMNYHTRRSVPGGGLYKALDCIRPVLQIHDELVFEVLDDYVEEVARHIRYCMENAVELNVPLKVKISVGKSFGNLKALETPVSSNSSSQSNNGRRHSYAFQHNPLLELSPSEVVARTATKLQQKETRSQECSNNERGKEIESEDSQLPVSRRIFKDQPW